jgi:hypothetical protein
MAAKAPESEHAEKDGYSGKGSSYTQIAGQKADSDQKAFADATAVQVKPSNENSSIRVGSKGDDGDVTQSNDATALAIAAGSQQDRSSRSIRRSSRVRARAPARRSQAGGFEPSRTPTRMRRRFS